MSAKTRAASIAARERYLAALRSLDTGALADAIGAPRDAYTLLGLDTTLRRHLVAAIKREALG